MIKPMQDRGEQPITGQSLMTIFVKQRRNVREISLVIFIVCLAVLATVIQPRFLDPTNLRDLLTQASPLLMVTLGQAFVILVRGLDLSVASLMATVAVLATEFNAESNAMIVPIFLFGIGFSALVGFVNGWLVTKRDVSPFLATLAMMIMLQGLRYFITQGAPVGDLPNGFPNSWQW